MLWLPVLPSCFLLIAEPSGLIYDPGATGRTAPPTQHGTGCSGLGRGCRDPGEGQGEHPKVGSGSFGGHMSFGEGQCIRTPAAPELSCGPRVQWPCDPGMSGPSQNHSYPSSRDSGISVLPQHPHPLVPPPSPQGAPSMGETELNTDDLVHDFQGMEAKWGTLLNQSVLQCCLKWGPSPRGLLVVGHKMHAEGLRQIPCIRNPQQHDSQ